MTRRWSETHACSIARLLAALALLVLPGVALPNGSDLPPQIIVQGFVKQDGDRLQLIVRFPLVMLSTFGFPKRGPGYLDLARMEPNLQQAAAAASQQIELAEDGLPMPATIVKARISPLADRSFQRYESALAHLASPALPVDTDLFWNQGFFDTQLDYRMRAATSRLSVRVNVAPEMGSRLKLRLQYVPAAGSPKSYELPGGTGWVPLDPLWHQAAWTFLKFGVRSPFALDRFVFLLCLVAPFRQFRTLLTVVVVMALTQAIALTAVGSGAVAESHWLPAIFAPTLAATSMLLAIGNLAAPSLRRRWFIAAVIGGLSGFGVGHVMANLSQFAGDHRLISMLAFNLGTALGEVASLGLAFVALHLLFSAVLGPVLGVIVLSVVIAVVSGNWLADSIPELAHELGHAVSEGFAQALPILSWLLPGVIVGAAAVFLPRTFEGARTASLRDVLLDRESGARKRHST